MVPTALLKNVIDAIGSCVLSIINNSLTSGQVPGYFKQAVVQPILKKTNLDTPNYRVIWGNFYPKIIDLFLNYLLWLWSWKKLL